MEKLETPYIAGKNAESCSTLENSLAVSQNVNQRITTPSYILEENENIYTLVNLCTHLHNSIIHNSQKVEATQHLSTEEWINKMWHYAKWGI